MESEELTTITADQLANRMGILEDNLKEAVDEAYKLARQVRRDARTVSTPQARVTEDGRSRDELADRLLAAARDLTEGDGGGNPEYERGIVQVLAQGLGMADSYADAPEAVSRMILGR